MRRILLFCGVLCAALPAWAQCGPLISTFPYAEGFEGGPSWTSGGTGNDWEWGTPAHPFINAAGGGTKSWCVGGVAGQFYEFDAQSWLMSPCFDFSALQRPWISLKIYWETERQYDGMVLQYSLDQGNTWDNVGAYGDDEDCLNANWYNESNVYNLDEASPKHGWSGRQGPTIGGCLGGQGSEEWLTATKCMGALAGEPNVRFRFLFGSGSTCNNYDGIAVDDILIQDSPLPETDITSSCVGGQYAFAAEQTCATGHTWDFGDPDSGADNSANGMSVTHTFSGPGQYTVTLTVLSVCGPPVQQTEVVEVLGVEVQATAANCGLANGSLLAVVNGGNGPFTYDWEPGSGATAQLDDLLPGTYTVTVSAPGSCPVTVEGIVPDEPSSLDVSVEHEDVSCFGESDGTATAVVTGGIAQSFAWSPIGGDAATATGLPGGEYTVEVADDQGCVTSVSVIIEEPAELTVTTDAEVEMCPGDTVVLIAEAEGGTAPYTYAWSPNGPQVAPLGTSLYTVTVTDAAGCISVPAPATVYVGERIQPTLVVDDVTGCAPHCVQFTPGPSGLTAYTLDYGDGSNGSGLDHCYEAGTYDAVLTVTDALGCTSTATFADIVLAMAAPEAGFIVPAVHIITQGPLQVVDASQGGTAWQWDLGGAEGEDSVQAPRLTFAAPGCVDLQQVVTNAIGCTDTARTTVCVEDEFAVYAPNAFTPNGDGMNERFLPITTVRYPSYFRLLIFDRWGGVLFDGAKADEGWPGENIADGVYAWRLEMRDSEHKLRAAQGHVVLLR